MKKLISVGLPLLLAALLFAAGTLLPQAAFRRQRQDYFLSSYAVPVEDVHPYGEEYEENKNALLAALRVAEKVFEPLDLEATEDESVSAYLEGRDRLADFFDVLLEYVPWLAAIPQSEAFSSRQEGPLYGEDSESWQGCISLFNEEYGLGSSISFDPVTGLPIYVVMYLTSEEEADGQALWEGLLAAYQEVGSITFLPDSSVGSGTSSGVKDQTETDTMVDASYIYTEMSAVSADGVFRLDFYFYRQKDELYFQVVLREA